MKKFFLTILALSFIMLPIVAFAQPQVERPMDWTGANLYSILEKIFQTLFYLLVLAAAIALVIAGFFFITAQGDAEKLQKARNFVLWALIGVGIAFLAKALIQGMLQVLKYTT